MLEDEFLNEINESDLPENFLLIAQSVGIETARKLIRDWGGIKINIPSPRSKSLRPALCRFIEKSKKIHSVSTIARSLNLSETTIRALID